jgi:GNAT superfamily N-acetyltransferase
VRIGLLGRDQLATACALLGRALPYDRVEIVAEEKLFGSDGARVGVTLGAWRDEVLLGVLATAGRWIKVLGVDAAARRQGIATQLLMQLDVTAKLRVGDHPGNYLSPGMDERYEEGAAFFRARGFGEVGRVENIRAPLEHPLKRMEVPGYRIQRVEGEERERVLGWIARAFAPVWAHEAARAAEGPRHALHAAFAGDTPVAFAAADGNNQGLGWFGPAGTDPAHRGKRLGEALLLRCLDDVRGLPEAGVIAWIGPKEFYRKTVAAVDDRRFVQLERATSPRLGTSSTPRADEQFGAGSP